MTGKSTLGIPSECLSRAPRTNVLFGCQNLRSERQCHLQEFRIKRRGDGGGDRESTYGSSVNARVVVLGRAEFGYTIASNPFPKTEEHPYTLHLFFLSEPPYDPDNVALNALKSDSEEIALIDNVFYLHAPDGMGRSKLAARVERLLGVGETTRNWRTESNIGEMARVVS